MKPLLVVSKPSIAEAWEEAIVQLHRNGSTYPGRYWTENDPVGRHAHMTIQIEDILAEPRIHRGFTCTPEDLWAYAGEITDGTTRSWEYTYHSRMHNWGKYGLDQYNYALDCLCRKPSSHKAAICLGDPDEDAKNAGDGTHIPCLRHISFELDKVGNMYKLNTYTHWRARNAIHASFNNIFGLSFFIERAASDLSERLGTEVFPASYVDVSDDFHYNGKDEPFVNRMVANLDKPLSERTWTLEEFIGLLE